jgi:hypothetical protein
MDACMCLGGVNTIFVLIVPTANSFLFNQKKLIFVCFRLEEKSALFG